MAYTCFDAVSTCDCNCNNNPELSGDVPLHEMEWEETNIGNCCLYTCSNRCSGGSVSSTDPTFQSKKTGTSSSDSPSKKFSKASGKFMRTKKGGTGQPARFSKASGKFMRTKKGGTGQPARFANQSGGGQIFGLSTEKALIAVGVAVAAYFIIKKVK